VDLENREGDSMRVFITGIAGFLGSHCAEYFRSKGDEVEGIDNLTKYELSRVPYLNPSIVRGYVLDRLDKVGAVLVKGDICEYDRLLNIVTNFKPDYIIHTAAQPAMTIALESPTMSCENNVLGTVNVLEVAHKLNIPVAICSTIHVYGNGDNKILNDLLATHKQYSELSELLTGNITPLHADKSAIEIYARAFSESYGLKVATFRLSGIYADAQWGGDDHAWTANFGWRTVLGLPIKVFGTDTQVRDIVYVDDVCRAFDLWYKHQESDIYNIGGGLECMVTLKRCLEYQSILSKKTQDIHMEDYRQGDLWYFICDIEKAYQSFKWKPTILPDEGLKKQILWIQKNVGLAKR
jgi:CDP-paratose 2-epimerase